MATPDETRAYYNANALRYAGRTQSRTDSVALREFLSRIPPKAKVFDAGCGSGRDLKFFRDAGFDARGVDYSEGLSEIARKHSGCEVDCSELAFFKLPRETFDGVWCHRVIRHLSPPVVQRVLGIFFTGLKPGGILFASIDELLDTDEEYTELDRTDDEQGPARLLRRYPANEFASLIRQTGFHLLSQGKSLETSRQLGFIAKRIG